MVWPTIVLGLEVHAAKQVLESRVGAQRIADWGDIEQGTHTSRVNGLFQPFQCLLFLSQAHIDEGLPQFWSILMLGGFVPLIEYLMRLRAPTRNRIGVSKLR